MIPTPFPPHLSCQDICLGALPDNMEGKISGNVLMSSVILDVRYESKINCFKIRHSFIQLRETWAES